MGTVRSKNTEIERKITSNKNEVLGKIRSQKSDLENKLTASKDEILDSIGDSILTPNVTFRANGISSMGDPGKMPFSIPNLFNLNIVTWNNFNTTEGFDGKYFTVPVTGTYFFRAIVKQNNQNNNYLYMKGSFDLFITSFILILAFWYELKFTKFIFK